MSIITARIVCLIVAASVVFGQGRLEGRGARKRFVSDKYGFTIAVPPGWLVDPSKDTPMYFSFSPTNAGDFNHQLKLPKGGGVISIVAQGALPGLRFGSISEWATKDAQGVSAESPRILTFEVPASTNITNAIISSYNTATFGPDDQSEHNVNVFWEFRQKHFAAHLLYPAHDPKGPELEKTFIETLRSIRPLGRSAKK